MQQTQLPARLRSSTAVARQSMWRPVRNHSLRARCAPVAAAQQQQQEHIVQQQPSQCSRRQLISGAALAAAALPWAEQLVVPGSAAAKLESTQVRAALCLRPLCAKARSALVVLQLGGPRRVQPTGGCMDSAAAPVSGGHDPPWPLPCPPLQQGSAALQPPRMTPPSPRLAATCPLLASMTLYCSSRMARRWGQAAGASSYFSLPSFIGLACPGT